MPTLEDLYLAVELHERLKVVGTHHTRFLRLILNGQLVNAEVWIGEEMHLISKNV